MNRTAAMEKTSHLGFVHLALGSLLSACSAVAPVPRTLVVSETPVTGQSLRHISPQRNPSPDAAAEANAELSQAEQIARTRYRDLDFTGALATIHTAQMAFESNGLEDFAALRRLLVLRAMNEQALQNESGARDALRNAIAIRPDEPLDTRLAPPPVQELFRTVLAELRRAPPVVLPIATEPTGAQVYVDGVHAGETPLSISTMPGRHVIRLEKRWYERRSLQVEVSDRNDPLVIALPSADEPSTATRALEARSPLSNQELHLARERLSAQILLGVHGAGVSWTASGLDLTTGERLSGSGETVLAAVEIARRLDDGDSIWESPWFWVALGSTAAIAATVAAIALSYDPGAELTVGR